ncbi:MAG TPA: GspE/PulE family protein [Vicinamibacterales bacterium]|nr:GspE/PulE family protein [Vicinamibacterales bacterium]
MSQPETRLGDLLIQRRLITAPDLQEALDFQKAAPAYVPLGQVLIDRGLVTRRQLHLLLEWAKMRPKLGELLIKAGAITDAQLTRALEEQPELALPLGETLIKLGYVTEEQMRQALCLQMNVPYLDLTRLQIEQSLARLINHTYAVRNVVVPVSQVGQTLTVAMNDPSDLEAAEELAQSTGCIIRVVTSSGRAIQDAIARLYSPSANAAEVDALESLELVQDTEDHALGKEYTAQSRRADDIVRQIFNIAISRGCSDVHMEPLSRNRLHIRFRIDGVLRELDLGSLQQACNENVLSIVSRVKILGKLDISERRRPQDGSFRLRAEGPAGDMLDFDLRVSVMPSYYGESVVVRILDRRRAPKSIDSLKFASSVTEQLKRLLTRTSGIVLITGPTGSGKSTTLYAALQSIHRPEIRVLTAEDPIEYVYEQFSQSEVDERIGNTFASYLRAFLRHDPEVIMVGEIRDHDTAEMALRAAMTGHLLLSTLHTSDAVSVVSRLVDLGVEPTLVGASLAGVLSQRLVRTICTDCRETYTPPPDLMREFFDEVPADLKWYRGRGCVKCDFSGYKGRRIVAELWIPSNADVILINKSAPRDELVESAVNSTYSMAENALYLLKEGVTNLEELMRTLPYATIYRMRSLVAV